MHYAFLASIIIASLLGAAAMSVVHAAEAPRAQQATHTRTDGGNVDDTVTSMEARPMEISNKPVEGIDRPSRESYYGQGFESRGISIENVPRGDPAYGFGRSD